MSSKNPVVHFEMPYKDANRVNQFYEKVFGWGMTQLGSEMGGYITAQTTETDKIPGIGLWTSFEDSEGNRVSILQPLPRA